jgi:cytochrome c553
VAALKGYKTKERPHGTMHAQASSMTDQDMEDIAAFITKAPVRP